MKHVINGKRASSNDYIMKYLNDTIEPGSTILDLGCGPKLYSSPFIQRCSKIVTVDAWENVQPDIVADLENTSVFDITKGEKFDYVLILNSYRSWSHAGLGDTDRETPKKLDRWLKKQALNVICTINLFQLV